jgi:hypothetical protein
MFGTSFSNLLLMNLSSVIVARLGIVHVKNDIINYNQEVEMFRLEMTSINMAFGFNYHFVYFCLTNFLYELE